MIQMITYWGNEGIFKRDKITLNTIKEPRSLDEFTINIIDLRNENIWRCERHDPLTINAINDFNSLFAMIHNSSKTNIVILFPQNQVHKYMKGSKGYAYSCELKDMIPQMKNIISKLYMGIDKLEVVYENTTTKIGDSQVSASFYFNKVAQILTQTNKSNKATTIKIGFKVILSTLDLKTYQELIDFLRAVNLINDKENIPEWVKEVYMFDDEKQLEVIRENNNVIKSAKEKISNAEESISTNNKYKSILHANGDSLVDVIFEILEEMLGCNLHDFVDKKKEDFLFQNDGIVYVGEIKGISSNVKSTNVTQLELHYQGVMEEHEEFTEQKTRQILIINHQRNIELEKRDSVDDTQIKLAKRNGSLIIETITLLRMFEKYKNGDITRKQCFEEFDNTGLLKI